MENIENNKLIVEFMGYKLHYIDYENKMPYYVHNEKYLENPKSIIRIDKGETLQYHSNWSWLMPVVSKIYSMDEYRDYKYGWYHIRSIELTTDIESVYNSVVEFIKWFNNNK